MNTIATEGNDFVRLLMQMQRALDRATMRDLIILQSGGAKGQKARELLAEAICRLHSVGRICGVDMPEIPTNIRQIASDVVESRKAYERTER